MAPATSTTPIVPKLWVSVLSPVLNHTVSQAPPVTTTFHRLTDVAPESASCVHGPAVLKSSRAWQLFRARVSHAYMCWQ